MKQSFNQMSSPQEEDGNAQQPRPEVIRTDETSTTTQAGTCHEDKKDVSSLHEENHDDNMENDKDYSDH